MSGDVKSSFGAYLMTIVPKDQEPEYTDDLGELVITKDGKTITLNSDESKKVFNLLKPRLMG